tara:strand:- start:1308 stop:1454 length:147 start_codon:yes stop_codon:yes gene_type:complete
MTEADTLPIVTVAVIPEAPDKADVARRVALAELTMFDAALKSATPLTI